MYDRILVPLDGSIPAAAALTVGEDLANRLGAELHVLGLVDKAKKLTDLPSLIPHQLERIETEAHLDIRPLSYGVAEDIAAAFDAAPKTLLVMQTWARGRTAGLIGNVSEEVLRLTRTPMVVIGPEPDIRPDWLDGPMLIATDGSHFGDSIVPVAAHVAKALSLETQLTTVVDPSSMGSGINVAAESNVLTRLAGSVAAITASPIAYDVLHGSDPAEAITVYADTYHASFIAMSTHGRSGLDRITHDSVAMDVIRHGHCPVLLNRPPVVDA